MSGKVISLSVAVFVQNKYRFQVNCKTLEEVLVESRMTNRTADDVRIFLMFYAEVIYLESNGEIVKYTVKWENVVENQ